MMAEIAEKRTREDGPKKSPTQIGDGDIASPSVFSEKGEIMTTATAYVAAML